MTDLPIRYVVNIGTEWFSNFSPINKNKPIAEYCREPRIKKISLKQGADNAKSGKNIYFTTTLSLHNSDRKYDFTGLDYESGTIVIYRTDSDVEPNELSDMVLVFTGTISEIVLTETEFTLSCLDIRSRDSLIDVKDGSVAWYLSLSNAFVYLKGDSAGKATSPIEPNGFKWIIEEPILLDPLGAGSRIGHYSGTDTYWVYLGAPWLSSWFASLAYDDSGNYPTDIPVSQPAYGGGWFAIFNSSTGDFMISSSVNAGIWTKFLIMHDNYVGTDASYNMGLMDTVILHLNKALGITYTSAYYDLTVWNTWRTYFRDQGCYYMSGLYTKSYSGMSVVENILASLNLTIYIDNNGNLNLHEFSSGSIKHIIKATDVLNRPDVIYDKDNYLHSVEITGEFGNTPLTDSMPIPQNGKSMLNFPTAPWCYSLTQNSYTFSIASLNGTDIWLNQKNRTGAISIKKTYENSVVYDELSKNTLSLTLPYVNQIDYLRNSDGFYDYIPQDHHWFRIQNRLDYFNWIPATIEIKVKSIEGFQLYDLVEYDLDRVDDTSWLITNIDYDTNMVKLKKEKESLILGYDLYENDLTVDTRDEGITFVDPALDREA